MSNEWLDTIVVARRDATARIVVLEVVSPDDVELPEFAAGAHVDVLVDGAAGLVRQYSLCGPPHDLTRYRLAVLAETASRGGSLGMHRLREGDTLRISRPRNRFGVSDEARRHLLVAGGIGVTPLLAMAHALEARGAEYELHYCARSRKESAFLDELEHNPRVRLHFDDGPDDQRLSIATDLGPPDPDTAIYVCGPGGFMDFVISMALEAGWPAEAIHKERFAPVENAAAHTAGRTFRVRLTKTGGEYEVKDGESVLDALLAGGVDAPYSCRQGICGECIVSVLAGEPDHRDDILTDRERADGMFTTCSSRAHSPILELDL
ncbi:MULTISPECIES: PDR/VanB family oxidoreductase [Streptomyces]|uniref:Vanillate O-demethylase oxidoreductase n=1 Tax=Streptomyces bottropensis ATCC 25435 TaxID=1054862 RepID=M3F6Z7_9ACTN|nr:MULTISPECIES: PDR/VanB family oxidoreductase [Streptomyces]EMF57398.1 vanillate O-demethylase oxidoreductase [Streptomyces bottropensis ATCC 25435]MZD17970.1 2Fe-2S iron-sulfur cluster binding domain-containing protein [Streptomyces sp. SID5476]